MTDEPTTDPTPDPDPRPYHERRRDLPHCPECLDPDCHSLVCDEAECR